MKRNSFGINLDEGIPLINKIDYDLLYVPGFDETYQHLCEWVKTGNESLMLGGQIGTGKTTLINKLFFDEDLKPDITLKFDQDSLNMDLGDFLAITLSGFIKSAIKNSIDLPYSELLKDLTDMKQISWSGLLEMLEPTEFSMEAYKNMLHIRNKISQNGRYIKDAIINIGKHIQDNINRNLFIFASGIDKFNKNCSGYLLLKDVLVLLLQFKTLFEVNSIHLFTSTSDPLHPLRRLYLTTFEESDIAKILDKRMGVYAETIKDELDVIAKWSGGNPRQAVRLLSHFQAALKNRTRSKAESIAFAIRETSTDFFSFIKKPAIELIKAIKNDGYLEASLVTLSGDRDTAQYALYGNWILLSGENKDTSWPAKINPLVKAFFEGSLKPEEPELKLLMQYADNAGISAEGLSFNRIVTDEDDMRIAKDIENEKTGEQLLMEFLSAGIEFPLSLNLNETLDIISAALLSKNRADRIIVAYNNKDILQVARAYITAKANSYEYQKCEHDVVVGGENQSPILKFKEILSREADIFSIEFLGKWTDEQLQSFDKLRDTILDYEIILWLPLEVLKNEYISKWTQLRQLFEIFILEDELFGNLTIENIKADMEFYSNLPDDSALLKNNVINNLEIVLKYLSEVKDG
jgi:hypothetical protein